MQRRLIRIGIGSFALVLVVIAAATAWRYWSGGAAPLCPPPATYLNRPTGASRVLVFAPHCDDETLGAGGLIQQAVAAGSRLRVVVMTNGDGFTLAVERQYHKLWVRPADYVRLAYLRQQETLAALRLFGVRPQQITFLGYPDRGLLPIWRQHWSTDQLYRSSYTHDENSPYATSYTPEAPFCADSLLADVTRLLEQENPTVVVLPHPNDAHPDHWATYALVTFALARRAAMSTVPAPTPQVYTYLVHRGGYPQPAGYRLHSALTPPASLVGTGARWLKLPLTPLQERNKYEAIRRYRTQMRLTGHFMVSFARRNELYAAIPARTVPLEGQLGGGREVLALDPVRDTLVRSVERAGDLTRLAAWCSVDHLWLQVTARAPLSRSVRYQLWIHSLPDGEPLCCEAQPGRPARWRSFEGTSDAQQHGRVWFRGDTMLVRLPLATLHSPDAIFVSAETHRYRLLLDRTAVVMAHLPWSRFGAFEPGSGPELSGAPAVLPPRDFPPLPVIVPTNLLPVGNR